MRFNKTAGNRQPQPSATGGTTARLLTPVKLIKDPPQIRLADAFARIAHIHINVVGRAADVEVDKATARRVANRITHQVGQHPPDQAGVH